MINRRFISDDFEENLSFLKTTYNLANYNSNYDSCIKEIKNITLVPRSGTHNNFKVKEEVIIYVINGELLYSDSLGNNENFYKGNIIYIPSGNGITYDIFNNGLDLLDIVEINLFIDSSHLSSSSRSPTNISKTTVAYSHFDNIPVNQWNYRISSTNGLALIKSIYDINIYSLSLLSDEKVDFTIGKNRQGFLFQSYGQSIFTTNNLENKVTLTGVDTLHITNENFEILAYIPSDLLLIETCII